MTKQKKGEDMQITKTDLEKAKKSKHLLDKLYLKHKSYVDMIIKRWAKVMGLDKKHYESCGYVGFKKAVKNANHIDGFGSYLTQHINKECFRQHREERPYKMTQREYKSWVEKQTDGFLFEKELNFSDKKYFTESKREFYYTNLNLDVYPEEIEDNETFYHKQSFGKYKIIEIENERYALILGGNYRIYDDGTVLKVLKSGKLKKKKGDDMFLWNKGKRYHTTRRKLVKILFNKDLKKEN